MASLCSQGTVTSACSSEQSFCTLKKQKVSQNNISATLNTITANQSKITASSWNRVYTILDNIYNYGKRENKYRNPAIYKSDGTTKKYSNVESDIHQITQNQYNQVLGLLSIDEDKQLSDHPVITKTLMDNLQNYINDYQLNKKRCNACNTACNTTCEAATQSSGCSECQGACMCKVESGQTDYFQTGCYCYLHGSGCGWSECPYVPCNNGC